MAETTLEVRLIRHAAKHSSKHGDAALRNQLTEEGKYAAWEYGCALDSEFPIEIICGSPQRNKDTAGFIDAGWRGLGFTDAQGYVQQYIPTIENLLEQTIPRENPNGPSPRFRRGEISRAEAMEQCYRFVLEQETTPDVEIMKKGARNYLAAVGNALQRHGLNQGIILLVGNDPNVGAVLQRLEPTAILKEVPPLQGVHIHIKRQGEIFVAEYSFTNNAVSCQGVLKQ